MARRVRNSLITAVVAVTAAVLALGAAPAQAAVGGSGPYPADYETSAGLPNHTIYRPQNLPAERLPVFVWGNGGCSGNGLSQQNFLREIASHGFLAIANGAPNGSGSTTAQQLTQSIDWAVAENSRPGGKYYDRLDTSRIAAGGFSCGGLEAYAVSGDPRVTTTTIFSSGLLNDADDYQLRRLTKPIAYFIGGPGDIAYPNAMDDWTKLPAGLPAFMGNLNVGHGGTYDQVNGGEFARVAVLYLKWRLKGDTTAGGNFVGANCDLCGTQWQVRQKNLTLDGGTPTTPPPSACSAAYSVQDQWNGGFVASVTVTAGTAAVNGWRVALGLPGGASISSLWNAVATGTNIVTNASYNGRLSPGQSTTFGFQGTGTGGGATVTCTAS
ncbi:cellulose binding domain-containing protein [Actinoplanes sp. NPDC049802]|uniref:cellulose binding domain-containing protein n=1 Tax=Actinoplanes sp. NPDC049802 TaxID=3154742 RepID=UPI0034111ECE